MVTLTKTLDPADYANLLPELAIVDEVGWEGQHEHRRWEYAMALKAVRTWQQLDPKRAETKVGAVDVGGAGSNLNAMLGRVMKSPAAVVDPSVNVGVEELDGSIDFSSYVVTCVSVLEHVKDEWTFLAAVAKLVRPGGMLFLTMDCGDESYGNVDTAHYHWMRCRLYTPNTWMELARRFVENGWEFLGEQDFSYNGHMLFGSYSFASLALRRKV